MKSITPQNSIITKKQVDAWCQSFKDFMRLNLNIRVPNSFFEKVELLFSDEIKPLPYLKTTDDAREEIKKCFDLNDTIDLPNNPENEECRRRIAEEISQLIGVHFEEVFVIIDSILNKTVSDEHKAYIAGEYVHDLFSLRIVLYNNVIDRSVNSGKTIVQAYEEVFVHELFHALHYEYAAKVSEEIEKRKDYTSKVVKESLAAYFEFMYCIEHNISTDIDGDWKAFEPDVYPYSGARCINAWDEFNDVLSASYSDMDIALRKLFNSKLSLFYDVKNRTEMIAYKKVKKGCIEMKKEKKDSFEEIIERFKEWLLQTHSKPTTTSTVSRIRRIEKSYDLLNEYAIDKCVSLIGMFTYSSADKKEGKEPRADIVIEGDYVKGLYSLKKGLSLFVTFLNEIGYSATPKYGKSMFMGSFDDFKRYVGPKCRNEVNIFCKPYRDEHNEICEYCGKKAQLQSAHIKERPIIINEILEKDYKKGNDYYEVDLPEFFDKFKKAHFPIENNIFFLCRTCHNKLDKTKEISVQDILDKR